MISKNYIKKLMHGITLKLFFSVTTFAFTNGYIIFLISIWTPIDLNLWAAFIKEVSVLDGLQGIRTFPLRAVSNADPSDRYASLTRLRLRSRRGQKWL